MPAVVQSLWIGGELSVLERLSIASFLAHGHAYHLYAYREVHNAPDGVILKRADAIIAEHDVFVTHRGSYAAFSDWFRWELLYAKGDYWVDTDVICLKPFDFQEDLVFGKQTDEVAGTAVLKFPAKHGLVRFMADHCAQPNRILAYDTARTRLKKLARKYLQGNRRGNIDWGEAGGPEGFTAALQHGGLFKLGRPFTFFYPIHYENWKCVFDETLSQDTRLFAETCAIHLWNELMRREKGFEKDSRFPKRSLIEQWKGQYL